MRGGTENVYGIVGLAKALELAVAEMEERIVRISETRQYLKSQLLEHFDDIRFNGDHEGQSLYTVLNVSFPPNPKNELLLLSLDIAGVSCSGGSACSSGSEKGSHVLDAIGSRLVLERSPVVSARRLFGSAEVAEVHLRALH